MPANIPAAMIEDKNLLTGKPWFLLYELFLGDGTTRRFTTFPENIYFPSNDGGRTPATPGDAVYESAPFYPSDLSKTLDDTVDGFTVAFSNLEEYVNLDERIGEFIDNNQDPGLTGLPVLILLVSPNQLSDSSASIKDVMYIVNANIGATTAVFILSIYRFDILGLRLPQGEYSRDICEHDYDRDPDGPCAFDAITGQATGGGATYIDLDTSEATKDDGYFDYWEVTITGGTGVEGETKLITNFAKANIRATIQGNWTISPDATTTYKLDLQTCNHRMGSGNETGDGGCAHHHNERRFGGEPGLPEGNAIYL